MEITRACYIILPIYYIVILNIRIIYLKGHETSPKGLRINIIL